MEKLKDLNDLFTHELKDLYSAEQQILEALPKMADATEHPQLRQAFQEHEQVTRGQVQRLQTIATELGVEIDGHTCKGMEGLLKEGQDVIEANADPSARDAALIGAAQRVEHYEIAGYGTARTYARMLGHDNAAELLQTTLSEEGSTDHRLTRLAEGMINRDAR
jgi:ferritin-like metal-binding protein YciE